MANDLTLNIGTRYDGEGMKKLDNALKNGAKTVRSTGQAMASISGELGKVGGEAGKAANAVSGLFSSFMQGGPIGAVIAGITTAVGFLVSAFQEGKELMKKGAEELKNVFSNMMDRVSQKFNETRQRFDAENNQLKNQQQQAAADRARGLKARELEIRADALNRRRDAQTPDELKAIELEKQASLQKLKIEQSYTDALARVKNLRDEVNLQQQSVDKLEKSQQEISQTISNLRGSDVDRLTGLYDRRESFVATISSGVDEKTRAKLQKHLNKLTEEISEFEEENPEIVARYQNLKKALETQTNTSKQIADAQEKIKQTQFSLKNAEADLVVAERERRVALDELRESLKKQQTVVEKQTVAIEQNAKKQVAIDVKRDDKSAERELEGLIKQKGKELRDQERVLANLDKQIENSDRQIENAAQKMQAIRQQWNQNPNQNFGDWLRQRNQADIRNQRQQREVQDNIKAAQGQAQVIADRIFRQGKFNARATLTDIGRFAELSEFLGFQNVNNQQFAQIQQARDRLSAKLFDKNGNLKRGIAENRADVQQFRKLDAALKKADAFKQAEKEKALAEKMRNDQIKWQRETKMRIDSIDDEMKTINKRLIELVGNSKL